MTCLDCGYDFDNVKYGKHTCPQCKTKHVFHAEMGWFSVDRTEASKLDSFKSRVTKRDTKHFQLDSDQPIDWSIKTPVFHTGGLYSLIEYRSDKQGNLYVFNLNKTASSLATDIIIKGIDCVLCSEAIEATRSIFGKILVGFYKKLIEVLATDTEGNEVVIHKSVEIPQFSNSYVCESCFDLKWKSEYVDHLGVSHLHIKPLKPTEATIKESYSNGNGRTKVHTVVNTPIIKDSKFDDNPSGKVEVSTMIPWIERGEYMGDLHIKNPVIIEAVDPQGYNNSIRDKVGSVVRQRAGNRFSMPVAERNINEAWSKKRQDKNKNQWLDIHK